MEQLPFIKLKTRCLALSRARCAGTRCGTLPLPKGVDHLGVPAGIIVEKFLELFGTLLGEVVGFADVG